MAIQPDQFHHKLILLQHMKGLKKGLKDELRRDARLIALADDIDKHVQYFDGTSLRTAAYTHQRTRLGSDWLPELVSLTISLSAKDTYKIWLNKMMILSYLESEARLSDMTISQIIAWWYGFLIFFEVQRDTWHCIWLICWVTADVVSSIIALGFCLIRLNIQFSYNAFIAPRTDNGCSSPRKPESLRSKYYRRARKASIKGLQILDLDEDVQSYLL